jgi:tetratricopeptide (TPR) repeat protein
MTSAAGHEDFGHKAIISGLDMMSNDMLQTKHHWFGFYYNYQGRVQTSSRPLMIWKTYYQQIKAVNNVISAIEKGGVDNNNKSMYGQALALRGYMYFMLARIFGPTYVSNESKDCVPMYLATTIEGKPRAKVGEVYTQIVNDLTKAILNLDGFTRVNKEKVDKNVAEAFLAQVYLEMGNYTQAASIAHLARQGYAQPSEAQWKDGFYDLNSNPDVMWGGILTAETTSFVASYFAHFDNTDVNGYAGGLAVYKSIDRRLYDAIPNSDYRKSVFQASNNAAPYNLPKYANTKFRDLSVGNGGDYVYLRASELFYIEAEALAKSGNESQAKSVLNEITLLRNPAYSNNLSGQLLIDEIILQKRIEMWGEGCAWFDMKRLGVSLVRNYTGTNHVISAAKLDIPAGDNRFLFQIPQAEILANPNIVQNP